jgi:hypothetical protein
MTMTWPIHLSRRHADEPRLCVAAVGAELRCDRPALPGKRRCAFHAGLRGPWAKAAR